MQIYKEKGLFFRGILSCRESHHSAWHKLQLLGEQAGKDNRNHQMTTESRQAAVGKRKYAMVKERHDMEQAVWLQEFSQ